MATFENFEQLSKVAPLGAIGRIIVYGDGSGHIERDNDDDVGSFMDVGEAEELIARLYSKYNKPIVVGQNVFVRHSSLIKPGEEGVTKAFDPVDRTFLVAFEDGTKVYLPTKALRATDVVRRVGEEVEIIPAEDEDGDTISGKGIIVKLDTKDKSAPFLVWLVDHNETFWFSEDELA